jgi:hypothetical protein
LIVLALWGAALWSVAWVVTAELVRRETRAWFEMQVLTGRMAGYDDLRVSGFPTALRLDLDAPYLADPFRGQSWSAPAARIEMRGANPVRLGLPLADTHTFLIGGHEVIELSGSGMRADIGLAGLGLRLDSASAQGRAIQADARAGWTATLDTFDLRLSAQPENPEVFDLRLDAAGLRPDAAALAALGAAGGEGAEAPALDTAHLSARLTFAAPPGVLDPGVPGLRELALDDLRLGWGTTEIAASGSLMLTPSGQPEGVLTFRLRDWRRILAAAVSLGLLHPDAARTWEDALATMQGNAQGSDGALEIRLGFRDGRTRLGPLPIGRAPVLWPPSP